MHDTAFWSGGDHKTVVAKIIRSPRRAVASGFPIRSKESKSFSNAERDLELLALKISGRIA
jgi:hypothetical protein